VLERLLEPCEGLGGEVVLLAVLAQVLDELGEDRLELLEGDRHVGGRDGTAQRVYGLESWRDNCSAAQDATRT